MTPLELEIQKILLQRALASVLKGTNLRGKYLKEALQEFYEGLGL